MKLLTGLFLLFLSACASRNPYESSSEKARSRFKEVDLPFESGSKVFISQGAFGKASHREAGNEYSWDFDVPFGTPVLAVEAGEVIEVWSPNKGGGCHSAFANDAHNIKIVAADGSVAQYVHLKAMVKKGQKIKKGEVIATTAENGFICQPQLHFGIYKSTNDLYHSPTRQTLPLRFRGIPQGLAVQGLRFVVP